MAVPVAGTFGGRHFDHARKKHHGGDLAGHVSASLDPLRHNHIYGCLLCTKRIVYRTNRMQYGGASRVSGW